MTKNIMIQGTMSNVGKSILCAALCRIFHQDGYKTAPFKSQNMALNSFITRDGREMGRAQVVQAEAADIEPDVRMNPILLKPTTDIGSQVIVNGKAQGNMNAKTYFCKKTEYIPVIKEAYDSLASEYEIVVIEGAGSPAEINLKQNDIVNMGFAQMVDAPVLLVGDIDRGGVFAQLYGTMALLETSERERVKGTIINKFRGDPAVLEPGIRMLEDLCNVPVAGVIPYLHLDIDDEDSLSERFSYKSQTKLIDIVVVRLPRISNFTDFSPLEHYQNISLRYVDRIEDFHQPDLIILPGTKNTIADLLWLRQSGLETLILKAASRETPIIGICGGFQMLGTTISDPMQTESSGCSHCCGLGLLNIQTEFSEEKTQRQTQGVFSDLTGIFTQLNGLPYQGYEIHMGKSTKTLPPIMNKGNVYGTYIHGIFDQPGISDTIIRTLSYKKGYPFDFINTFDSQEHKNRQYDLLADAVRKNLDMDFVYRILERRV